MNSYSKLQRSLYRKVLDEFEALVADETPSLRKYGKDFRDDQKGFRDSSISDLTEAIRHSDFVFIGDFHTLRQSQRLLIRLLKDQSLKRPKSLGLEILSPSHMPDLNRWLRTRSSKNEERLRASLNLENRFGSSTETYLEIFSTAFKLGIELIPLTKNRNASLQSRDRLAAEVLEHAPRPSWIFFGEFHVARTHLPSQLQDLIPEARILVIQQNEDRASLKRLERIHEPKNRIVEARPLKIRKGRPEIRLFGILHTPLWIKYQSYIDRAHGEKNSTYDNIDPLDQVRWSLRTLIHFLHDPRYRVISKLEKIYDFHVSTTDDTQFEKVLSGLNKNRQRQILKEIDASRIAYIKEKQILLMTDATLNSAAEMAGLYLFQYLSHIDPKPNEFYLKTLMRAVAYFLSKLLNHSRKAPGFKSIENEAILGTENFAFKYLPREKIPQDLKKFVEEAAVHLGRYLSDHLFEAFLIGEFSIARLNRILQTTNFTNETAFEVLVEFEAVGKPYRPQTLKKKWA